MARSQHDLWLNRGADESLGEMSTLVPDGLIDEKLRQELGTPNKNGKRFQTVPMHPNG